MEESPAFSISPDIFIEIARNSPNGVIFIDNDDTIRFWNRGAERIFGWREEEITGKKLTLLYPSRALKQYRQLHSRLQDHTLEFETELVSKEGKRLSVFIAENIIHSPKGEILGRGQIIQNISTWRQLERQLQHSEKLTMLGHLAAGVAHEIGNPLSSLSSILQLLKRKSQEPWLSLHLEKMENQVNRIARIVRQLVDFARPSTLKSTTCDVNEIIRNSVGLLSFDSRARLVNFQLQLEEHLPSIKLVPDQLHQVILNLLINALDALQNDGGEISITTAHKQDWLEIIVTDNGIGIPEELQEHIFEPFFTTKEVGSGTGLGLSVSHGIIKNIGGEISFQSKPGVGTSFTIRLPLKERK